MVTVPTIGQTGWGQVLNDALNDLQNQITANAARVDRPGIYVPNGWGTHWKTARNSGTATLSTLGGSSTQGYYASNLRQTGWVDLLRNALQSQYGDGGSGYRSSTLSSLYQTSLGVTAAAVTHYASLFNGPTLTGTWSVGGNEFGPGIGYVFTSTIGDSWTLSVRGTEIDMYVVAGTTNNHTTYSYQIDGGAVVNVPTTGTADNIQKTTVTGLSAGTHQVVIRHAGTAGQFISVCGITGRNTTGIVVNNLAKYGSQSSSYIGSDQSLTVDWNGGHQHPAHLVILTAGPNDANNAVSGDTWARRYRIIFEGIRNRGGADGDTDLMILLPHIGTFDTTNILYQDYAQRARGLAEAFDAAFINMWAIGRNSWNKWNSLGYWSNASSPGTSGTDSVHPSDAGHDFIFDTVHPIINGS